MYRHVDPQGLDPVAFEIVDHREGDAESLTGCRDSGEFADVGTDEVGFERRLVVIDQQVLMTGSPRSARRTSWRRSGSYSARSGARARICCGSRCSWAPSAARRSCARRFAAGRGRSPRAQQGDVGGEGGGRDVGADRGGVRAGAIERAAGGAVLPRGAGEGRVRVAAAARRRRRAMMRRGASGPRTGTCGHRRPVGAMRLRSAARGDGRSGRVWPLPCGAFGRWAIQDSNLGPLPYQRSALTD
ncbi:MAG: hypothetical protein QOJ21_1431 [Solirubrobacteraceae bacterium]|nr:hypothetical protein [Solirubrobacteraceae bacterium]